MTTRTAAVYSLVNKSGEAIYIGVSSDVTKRIKTHRSKPWWDEVDTWKVTERMPYPDAEQMEHEMIFAQKPRYNVASKDGRRAWEMCRDAWLEAPAGRKRPHGEREDIAPSPLPPLTVGQAAKRLGVTVATVRRWEREGKISAQRTPGGQRRFDRAEIERARSAA